MAQLDNLAFVVRDVAKPQIGVGKLAKDLAGGLGHFRLHGEQVLFLAAERMRLVAEHALENEPEVGQTGDSRKAVIAAAGIARISGRMKLAAWAERLATCMIAALHPLIFALADVLGRFQEGVVAEAFRGAIEIEVQLQTGGERLGAFAQLAPERGIFGDAAFPGGEGSFPGVVRGEEAGKVPGVGRVDFAAGGELFDFGHGKAIVGWVVTALFCAARRGPAATSFLFATSTRRLRPPTSARPRWRGRPAPRTRLHQP